MIKVLTLVTSTAFLAMITTSAFAAPKVSLNIVSEKKVSVQVDGKTTITRVPAENIDPGEIIINTIKYQNNGDEEATDVVLDIPLPIELTYIAGSAKSEGSSVTFSIDKGKSYKRASLLTYEVILANGKRQSRKATPDSYTHIRWVVKSIPAGKKGSVSYQGRVK